MSFTLSKSNPDYEQIKEQGWAYIQINRFGKTGAPYADENYEPVNEEEQHIVFWEEF